MENAAPKKDGLFPEPLEEGATGKLDNKGAIFIPGGLIYKDVDEIPICYDSNSKENSLTGLTRLVGIGNFGEFATFSFEQINQTLIRELKRKHQTYTSEDIFAEYKDICVLGILRIYSPTKKGKRPQKYSLHIVSPEKDIGFNMDQLRHDAQKRYHFRVD